MCGEVLDRWGDHALSCCCGGDRVLRHNAFRNVVCSAVAEFDNNDMSNETKCETNYSINNKWNNTRNMHIT